MSPLPLTRAALIAAVERDQRFTYTFFWKATPGVGAFSQWWVGDFTVDGQVYSSAEQFMMAGKAAMMGDEATRARILRAQSPKAIKALGRQVAPWDEARWQAERFALVTRGNVAKFSQDLALREILLGTGDAVLVEASPLDRLWGIGLAEDDPRALDPRTWRGENLLGFALMAARDQLRG